MSRRTITPTQIRYKGRGNASGLLNTLPPSYTGSGRALFPSPLVGEGQGGGRKAVPNQLDNPLPLGQRVAGEARRVRGIKRKNQTTTVDQSHNVDDNCSATAQETDEH
jgi:hypothetical protein